MEHKEAVAEKSAPARQAQPPRPKKFAAPDEFKAEFGVQSEADNHVQGVVATEHVRDLLDAFGLHERTEVQFPFQYLKHRNGEIWRIRIENAAAHTVKGKPVIGHQWVYMQDKPERVAGVQ